MSATRLVLRRKKAAEWTAINFKLDLFEIGIETDSDSPKKVKLGDGVTSWIDLPYWNYNSLFGSEPTPDALLQYAEIAATSNGQSVFSFPEANGKFICSLFVEGLKIPRSRFTHVGDNITLTLDTDIEGVETDFEISIFYNNTIPLP